MIDRNMSTGENNRELDVSIPKNLLGYHIRLAQVAVFKDFVSSLSAYDMTPSQFGTMAIINSNPGIKQTALAREIHLDRSSIVPMIDRMEKTGLVIREKLANDRRTNALKLTAQGTKLLQEMIPIVLAHEAQLASNLTKDEQIQLVNLLKKIFPRKIP